MENTKILISKIYTITTLNMNNHQKSTFQLLSIFLNSALSLPGLSSRKASIEQKLNVANHSYLRKGLIKKNYTKLFYVNT